MKELKGMLVDVQQIILMMNFKYPLKASANMAYGKKAKV